MARRKGKDEKSSPQMSLDFEAKQTPQTPARANTERSNVVSFGKALNNKKRNDTNSVLNRLLSHAKGLNW